MLDTSPSGLAIVAWILIGAVPAISSVLFVRAWLRRHSILGGTLEDAFKDLVKGAMKSIANIFLVALIVVVGVLIAFAFLPAIIAGKKIFPNEA